MNDFYVNVNFIFHFLWGIDRGGGGCVLLDLMANSQTSTSATSETTKSITTILLLIFAAPIGFFFMCYWTKWPMVVKVLVSIFYVPLATIAFVSVLLAIVNIGSGRYTPSTPPATITTSTP